MEINSTTVMAVLLLGGVGAITGGALGHSWEAIVAGSGSAVIGLIGLIYQASKPKQKLSEDEEIEEYVQRSMKNYDRNQRYIRTDIKAQALKRHPGAKINSRTDAIAIGIKTMSYDEVEEDIRRIQKARRKPKGMTTDIEEDRYIKNEDL